MKFKFKSLHTPLQLVRSEEASLVRDQTSETSQAEYNNAVLYSNKDTVNLSYRECEQTASTGVDQGELVQK